MPTEAVGARGSAFAGTWALVRLALRRDRVVMPAWVAGIAGLLVVSVASVVGLYDSEAARAQYAAVAAASPVARAFDGPMAGTSLGAITMTETFGILAILASVMSIQAVVRHTRREEETGRRELIGSAVVGRHAPLTAGLAVAFSANLLLGVGAAVTLRAHALPLQGSVIAAVALAAVGCVFAAVTAVTAQASETARGATGLAAGVLGLAFLLRAVGDAAGEVAASGVDVVSAWPSWLSPIGWGQQVRPFDADHWWLLGLHLALAGVLVATAFFMAARRDLGAGLMAVRPGAPSASRWLRSPFALAVRLQRGAGAAWAVGLIVLAAVFGAIGEEADTLLQTSDELAAALAALGPDGSLVDAYFAFMAAFVAVAAAGFTVQSVLRARGEEQAGRAEPLLVTPVSRSRWLLGHVACAAGGTVAILAVAGASAGLAYGVASGEWDAVGSIVVASSVHVPAALALGGFVVATVAAIPRWAVAVSWVALAGSLVMGQLGALLDLPQWLLNISPFTHVPAVPAADVAVLPLLWLLVAAVSLTVLGLVWFRRRDVPL